MAEPEEYNYKLCEERHEYLKEWCTKTEAIQKKLSNRFLAIMTTLTLNLIVVIIVLVRTFTAGG